MEVCYVERNAYGRSTLSTSKADGDFLSPIFLSQLSITRILRYLSEILYRFLYWYDKLDYVCHVTDNYSSTIRSYDFARVHTSCAHEELRNVDIVIYHREKPRRNNIYRVIVVVVSFEPYV